MQSKIDEIKITPLKIISDHRGSVMHILEMIVMYFKNLEKFTFQLYLKRK